jgi:hypothetical protein
MAVSPMPGYEIPPDVPCIPRGIDPDDWLQFNYRILNPEEDDTPSSPSKTSDSSASKPTAQRESSHDPQSDDDDDGEDYQSPSESESDSTQSDEASSNTHSNTTKSTDNNRNYTLPELHAHASRAYHPQERWQGWHPSRHYRLMLLYCDHTVMSYEFWHDWKD